jgi:DNA-binding NtrC family response regulator
VDCRRDEPRLRAALEGCLARVATNGSPNLVLAAWGGTLYLDHVTALGPATQKLVRCALHSGLAGGADAWPLRISAGDDFDPENAVQSGRFLPELHDALDKIRVELDRPAVA